MSITASILAALEIINAATLAVNAAAGAIEAAQTGDEAEADILLAKALANFSQSVSDWDAAGPE